jgi:hypothetical protein
MESDWRDDATPCYYCGRPASAVDHVIPKAVLRSIGDDKESLQKTTNHRVLTVPTCRECNTLLGATTQSTLKGRKAYLKERIRRRYKQVLKTPYWNEEDIGELGPTLRQAVRGAINMKKEILARLRW